MSTICKLDPMVRAERTHRRQKRLWLKAHPSTEGMFLLKLLKLVSLDPTRTGSQKAIRYQDIESNYREYLNAN